MWALAPSAGVLPALLLLLPLIGQAFGTISLSANTTVNVLVGNNISMAIEYVTTDALSPDITWANSSITFATIRNGVIRIYTGYQDRVLAFPTGSILITNAMLWYSGNYTVRVEELGVPDATAIFQVTVYEPIGVVSLKANPMQVTEGDSSVTLSYVLSQGQGTAAWTKDGVSIGSNASYALSGNTLTISKPNTTDSGLYNCTVSNPVSRNSGVYNLSVSAGLSPGAIAGIVVGSVLGALLIILLLVLLVCCIRKRKGQKQRPSASYPTKKSRDRAQMDGIRTVEATTAAHKAGWSKASVSSSTLTLPPPVYNTHNATFRNTSISTISGPLHSNNTLANSTNSTVDGITRKKTTKLATSV